MSEPLGADALDARERFVSLVSHELRSPLNGIKNWAHVLQRRLRDAGGDPAGERALEGILLGIEQELALIEELVEASHVLGGTMELSRQPVRLEAVLADALACCEPAARAKQVQLERSTAASAIVDGDFARLERLLSRLLDHSIRFSPSGSRVKVDSGRENGQAWVVIVDEGPAIPPSVLERLFDPFAAVDETHGRRAHVLGLVLPVSRRVAELHGGALDCSSDASARGATFRLTLPVLQPAEA